MKIWEYSYIENDKFYSKETKSPLNGEYKIDPISIEEVCESDYTGITKVNFKNGVLHGNFKQIIKDKGIYNSLIGEFDNGVGVITEYDENKNIVSKGDYHLYFFSFGKEKPEPNFYLQIFNQVEFYSVNLELTKKIRTIKEETDTPFKYKEHLTRHYYYKNQSLQYYETFSNTDRHGEYKSFYENGVVKLVCEYKNHPSSIGGKHGFCKEYYETGLLKSEGSYRDGVKDGRWVEYHNNGKI